MKSYIVLIVTLILYYSTSCKKFTEIDPPKYRMINTSVFASDASANAAMMGIYTSQLAGSAGITGASVGLLCGLSADELLNGSSDPIVQQFYNNALSPTNYEVGNFWSGYNTIYQANAIIEGLEQSTHVSDSTKALLTAEAKFIRAFVHFYLVNLFGEIPYITTTDYKINTQASRQLLTNVYQQIVNDLMDAEAALPAAYNYTAGERVRPIKWAASALLARAYLYQEDWTNAEKYASLVIGQSELYELALNPTDVFLATSKEAIWQIAPVQGRVNTYEAVLFSPSTPPSFGTYLNKDLVFSFSESDKRKLSWIDSTIDNNEAYYFAVKYKALPGAGSVTEYSTVLRLAEQYLIRAEARLMQGKLTDENSATSDINIICNRAALSPIISADASALQSEIEKQRQLELFSEWGHRWFDLKRWNKTESVLHPVKGDSWQNTDALYPIPQIQIQNAPNMRNAQNPGYQ